MTVKAVDTLVTGQVSITTSPTLISAARRERVGVMVVNHGTADVFIGNSDVTTSTGVLLVGTAGFSITLPATRPIYGVVATSTQTVSFIEVHG